MAAKRTRTSSSQRTEALERRVRELEAQICNLAIQVAALAARSAPTYPSVPYYCAPNPVPFYEGTCETTLGDLSYGGTS